MREPAKSEKQIGVSMPAPLSARLDGLVPLALQADRPTTRKGLVAVLIERAGEFCDLPSAIRARRLATLADCVIAGQDPRGYLDPPRGRGPRPSSTYSHYFLIDPADAPVAQGDLGSRIDAFPTRQLSIAVPVEVDQALDQLVAALVQQGERTTRREVVEALILAAPTSRSKLGELLRGRTPPMRKPAGKPRPAGAAVVRRAGQRSGRRKS